MVVLLLHPRSALAVCKSHPKTIYMRRQLLSQRCYHTIPDKSFASSVSPPSMQILCIFSLLHLRRNICVLCIPSDYFFLSSGVDRRGQPKKLQLAQAYSIFDSTELCRNSHPDKFELSILKRIIDLCCCWCNATNQGFVTIRESGEINLLLQRWSRWDSSTVTIWSTMILIELKIERIVGMSIRNRIGRMNHNRIESIENMIKRIDNRYIHSQS